MYSQFSIVAKDNKKESEMKAFQLADSLRCDAAGILGTLPENQKLNFDTFFGAAVLCFGEEHLKDYTRIQLKFPCQKAGGKNYERI